MTAFRATAFNVLGARFSSTSSWAKRRAQVVRRLDHVLGDALSQSAHERASVNLLTECYATEATYLGRSLNLATVTHRGSTIAYHRSWQLGRTWRLDWLGTTHGAIIAELARDGVTINAVASHLPPFAWRGPYRAKCMSRLAGYMHGWSDPTLIGTDANWRGMETWLAASNLGYRSARGSVPEKATTGVLKAGKAIDYLLVRNMTVRRFEYLPGWGSDHHMISASLTAPKVSPL